MFVNTFEYHYDFQLLGCFLHAGHEYNVENVRFHFYIDKPNGNVRKKNEDTYFYKPAYIDLKDIWDDKWDPIIRYRTSQLHDAISNKVADSLNMEDRMKRLRDLKKKKRLRELENK